MLMKATEAHLATNVAIRRNEEEKRQATNDWLAGAVADLIQKTVSAGVYAVDFSEYPEEVDQRYAERILSNLGYCVQGTQISW